MFILKKRQYTWLDMYRIPFSCAPAAAILVTLQKAITALVNVFQVIVVANFLDGMISFLMDQGIGDGFMLWFILMLLMVSWKRVSYHIGRVFTKSDNHTREPTGGTGICEKTCFLRVSSGGEIRGRRAASPGDRQAGK